MELIATANMYPKMARRENVAMSSELMAIPGTIMM
jgi:hypothetical protein